MLTHYKFQFLENKKVISIYLQEGNKYLFYRVMIVNEENTGKNSN